LRKQLANDFFAVAKMKVQISGTDVQVIGNVVGGDCHNTKLIEEFNTDF